MKKLIITLGLTASILGMNAQAGSRDTEQLATILVASAVTTAILASHFDHVDVRVETPVRKHYVPARPLHHHHIRYETPRYSKDRHHYKRHSADRRRYDERRYN